MVTANRVLATRCPDCHTVFRVVADQLKLRDGLVRCGTCRHVFDGRAALCQPPGDTDDATDVTTIGTADAPAIDTAAVPRLFDESPLAAPTPEPLPVDEGIATIAMPDPMSIASVDEHEVPPASSDVTHRNALPFALLRAEDTPLPGDVAEATPDDMHNAAPTSMVPLRRGPRIAWRIAAGLAVLTLAGQWVWLDREALVDRWPVLRAPIAQWGALTHGTVAPAHVRDALSLEIVTLETGKVDLRETATATATDNGAANASAIDATANSGTALTLTVFVHNKAAYAVAYPSLELTLSNADAKPVVRRVFRAADYQTDTKALTAGMPAHSEHTIRLRLTAQPTQAALAGNFRVLAFYP